MSSYICKRYNDAAAFLDCAGLFLLRNEAEHNLILGIATLLRTVPNHNAYLVAIEHDGEVVGCAFRTPPFKLGITRMPSGAAEALVEDVIDVCDDVPSVLGNETVAAAVADGIARKQGKTAQPGLRQRIYQLDKVIPPASVPAGKFRVAEPSDAGLMTQWLNEFARETNHGPGDIGAYTTSHITNKTAFLWDDDDPKTISIWAAKTPNGVRIGFVYTPPEARGHGYASACVASASQRALDSGYKSCFLYTDLNNPTSNSIYQKIGYQPVCDVTDYHIQ